ncbi:(3R)-3-hydroxyacyl-CoA dehydrogenase isoform X1 [Rhipicephalus microplus]|uniref:(3R)-3-hydroxyacyl-CoA dehydrogenase isoform X1 n=1 Tax=Rhipicephalus microplus TaxID=6941 RepID=UPI003F6B62D6
MYTADNHTAHRITFANVPRLPLLAVALAHGRIGPPSCRLALLGTPIRLQSLLVLVSGFANRTVGLVLVSFAASELCSSGYRAPISCACGSDGPENSENIDMSLTGRLAAVTGGASGIGKAVAFALAKEGAVVIVGDINFCGAQETAAALPGVGHPHQAFRVDVRSGESIETFFAAIMKMFKVPLSIAVSCAGILKPAPLVDMSEEFFDEIMDINFKGTFLFCRGAVQAMQAAQVPNGVLVTVASNWAHSGSPRYSAYAASKAATVAFTKSLALELAVNGMRCNCVLPSYTDTPMTASNSPQEKARDAAKSALGRAARPDEVADVVVFLCGPRSSYVNGSAIDINGGAVI